MELVFPSATVPVTGSCPGGCGCPEHCQVCSLAGVSTYTPFVAAGDPPGCPAGWADSVSTSGPCPPDPPCGYPPAPESGGDFCVVCNDSTVHCSDLNGITPDEICTGHAGVRRVVPVEDCEDCEAVFCVLCTRDVGEGTTDDFLYFEYVGDLAGAEGYVCPEGYTNAYPAILDYYSSDNHIFGAVRTRNEPGYECPGETWHCLQCVDYDAGETPTFTYQRCVQRFRGDPRSIGLHAYELCVAAGGSGGENSIYGMSLFDEVNTEALCVCGCPPDPPLMMAAVHAATPRVYLGDGPGTELAKLIKSLGLGGIDGCGGCQAMVEWMDRLGVSGCELVMVRETVLARLRERAASVGWAAKLKAGVKAAAAGLVLNPLDPAPGLLAEAVRRAEAPPG